MNRRSWTLVALAALLASLTLVALAPLATADHAYSHRYIVYGRVVDAQGNPVPDLAVDLGYQPPFEPEGPCGNQPGTETQAFGPTRNQPVTNHFGEFIFCFHTHGLSRGTPGSAIIKIESPKIEKTVEFDGFMRYSFVPIQLEDTMPNANTTANGKFYTFVGRAWESSKDKQSIEGVSVWGDTLHNKDYNLTVEIDGREPETISGQTNNYGDFSVRMPVESRPTGGKVKFSIEGYEFEESTYDIDPEFGVTHIRAQAGKLHTTPGAPLVALLGLVVIAALFARRK